MTGNLNTFLYIASLLVLVLPAGHWLFCLWKSPNRLHRTLMWLYVVFVISSFCSGLHMLNICVAEVIDRRVTMSVLTNGFLFFLPVLILMQQTIIDSRPVSTQTLLIHLLGSLLYSTFDVFLWLFYGIEQISATSWMYQTDVVVYNYLMFMTVIIGIIVSVWRYMRYRFRVSNYFTDRDKTDCSSVRDLTNITIFVGVLIYLFLLVSFRMLHQNWPVTLIFLVLHCIMLNLLGHALCCVKGEAVVPADFDWTDQTLTLEQITSMEERYQQANELMSAKSATKNIGAVIEEWVGRTNPSYLRAGITLTEAAYEMKIPANMLSGYINKTLNTNFNQWVNAYRLKYVKYLLITTNNTLDDIAEASGFATRNLLSRTFKAHEGITPSEFRSKNKQ